MLHNVPSGQNFGFNVNGSNVVVGAVGLEGLKEKIGVARCGKATC